MSEDALKRPVGTLIIDPPPPHILQAAATIHEWMVRNGHEDWRLGPICSRSFADKLDLLRHEIKRASVIPSQPTYVYEHAYKPHEKYPWFCRNCGYPEQHMMHTKKEKV